METKRKHHQQKIKVECPNCHGKTRIEVKLWSNISEGHDCYAPVMCVKCQGKGYVFQKVGKI
jgi:hypothetical protein